MINEIKRRARGRTMPRSASWRRLGQLPTERAANFDKNQQFRTAHWKMQALHTSCLVLDMETIGFIYS